ncbi:MAG: zinc-ribbon domain-containing protein [Lachnospiraceae bacterium]|nr:zinc-ribbon domain-containing protein [Lachnospiraceae bacterium]
MFCGKCGNQLKDTSRFCPKCGTPVASDPDIPGMQAGGAANYQGGMVNPAYQAPQPAPMYQAPPAPPVYQAPPVNPVNVAAAAAMAGAVPAAAAAVGRVRRKGRGAVIAISIIAVVLVLLAGGAVFYLHNFVTGPESTVEKLIGSLSDMDINGVIDCYNPRIADEYKGIMSAADSLIGLTGFKGNMEALAGLAPLFGANFDTPEYTVDIKSVEYSGGAYEAFPIKFDDLGAAFASTAKVKATVYTNGEDAEELEINLKKYDKKWLIEDELFQ